MPYDYNPQPLPAYKLPSPTGVMNDLAEMQMRRQEAELRAYKMGELQNQQAQQFASESALREAQGDPEKAASILELKGYHEPAARFRAEVRAAQKANAQELSDGYKTAELAMTQASQLLQGLKVPAPDDADGLARANSAWKQIAPTYRKIVEPVHPELAKAIPEDFDPDWLSQAIPQGQKIAEYNAQQKEAFDRARQAISDNHTIAETHKELTASLASSIAALDPADPATPAHIKATLTLYSTPPSKGGLGASPATIAPFEGDDTARVIQSAKRMAGGKPPELGTFGDYLSRIAIERKIDPANMSAATIANARTVWDAAARQGSEPPKVGSWEDFLSRRMREDKVSSSAATGAQIQKYRQEWGEGNLSEAQKAVAERWRDGELRRLDHEFQLTNAPDYFSVPGGPPKMTDDLYQARKESIENSYLKQISAPAAPAPIKGATEPTPSGPGQNMSPLGPRIPASAPQNVPVASVPTPQDQAEEAAMAARMQQKATGQPVAPAMSPAAITGQNMSPVPPRVQAPPPVAAPAVPDDIRESFKDAKPGQYAEVNGTFFRKDKDGSVKPFVPPPAPPDVQALLKDAAPNHTYKTDAGTWRKYPNGALIQIQ